MNQQNKLFKSDLLEFASNISHEFCKPDFKIDANTNTVHQIHSSHIQSADNEITENLKSIKSDGLISSQEKKLAIQTADCIPILVASRNTKFFGAIHAGWKGVLLGIVPEIVNQFINAGQKKEEMLFAFGPSIQKCCLEVSDELIMNFEEKWGENWKKFEKPYTKLNQPKFEFTPVSHANWLDLQKIAQYQLYALGIRSRQIDTLGICTYCHKTNNSFTFASYRRSTHLKANDSSQITKRQWSWISLNHSKVN